MKKLMLLGCGVLLLAGIAVGAKLFVGQMVDTKLRQVTERVKDRADIGFQDVELEIMGLNLVVRGVDVVLPTGQKAFIEKVIVHDMDVKNKPPLNAVVDLEGFTLAVNEENFGREYEAIRELGYEKILADVHLDYVYNPAQKNLQLKEFVADAPGIARVQAALSLSSFELAKVRNLELDDLVIERLRFSYKDRSFLRKIVEMTQTDEQEIIEFLVAGLREDIQRARARQQHDAAKTLQEVISFIETPHDLEIDVVLGGQTAMQQIMTSKKITEIVKLFSIRVEAAG